MQTALVQKNRETLLAMRARIRGQAASITESLQNEGRSVGDLSHVPTHPADVDSEGLDADLELKRSEESLLDEIDEALRRMDEGTYGTCAECGTAIAKERLEILPYASHCVRCAEKLQQQLQD